MAVVQPGAILLQETLIVSGDISDCAKWELGLLQHLVGRGQECCLPSILQRPEQPPTKNQAHMNARIHTQEYSHIHNRHTQGHTLTHIHDRHTDTHTPTHTLMRSW